jgi:hypothetical protein
LVLRLGRRTSEASALDRGGGEAPDGAVAGVYAIVARHPTDEARRVYARMLSSHRGG